MAFAPARAGAIFSDSQEASLRVAGAVVSALSLCGSLTIIGIVLGLGKHLRKFLAYRLVAYLAVCDTVYAISVLGVDQR